MVKSAVLATVGSVFVGVFYEEQLKELLAIPKEIKIVGLFPICYPAGDAKSGPPRKQLDTFVHYEQWKCSDADGGSGKLAFHLALASKTKRLGRAF